MIDFRNWWLKVQTGKDTEVDTDTKWKKAFVSSSRRVLVARSIESSTDSTLSLPYDDFAEEEEQGFDLPHQRVPQPSRRTFPSLSPRCDCPVRRLTSRLSSLFLPRSDKPTSIPKPTNPTSPSPGDSRTSTPSDPTSQRNWAGSNPKSPPNSIPSSNVRTVRTTRPKSDLGNTKELLMGSSTRPSVEEESSLERNEVEGTEERARGCRTSLRGSGWRIEERLGRRTTRRRRRARIVGWRRSWRCPFCVRRGMGKGRGSRRRLRIPNPRQRGRRRLR